MRFASAAVLTASVLTSLFSGVVGQDAANQDLAGQDSADLSWLPTTTPSTDVCGEVDAVLKVPNLLLHGKFITIGTIKACLCISTLPFFISTNVLTIAASALVGRDTVTATLTDMINNCNGHQTCYYPPHAVPVCSHGNPCSFTCKDGYTPYPASRPTQCVCNKPFTECNGKCGFFYGCPSGHVKRDVHFGSDMRCQQGLSVCGVLGRNARSWECVDTHNDLESCGGCIIPLRTDQPDGVDCTAIQGISDVSCVKGKCAVHRCMPGYEIDSTGNSCVYVEEKDPAFLASQYGLEHTPL